LWTIHSTFEKDLFFVARLEIFLLVVDYEIFGKHFGNSANISYAKRLTVANSIYCLLHI
jgi:hypothetical protein